MQHGSGTRCRPALMVTAIALALGAVSVQAQTTSCGPNDDACLADITPPMQCGYFPLYAERVPLDDPTDGKIHIASEDIDSDDGQHYQLQGHVKLRKGDQVLRARRVQWQRLSGAFTADNRVRYQNGALLLKAPHIEGNSKQGGGQARDVTFQMFASRGNGHAAHIAWQSNNLATLNEVSYSTCAPGQRQWELRAERIDIDQNKHVGYAHDVTMRLGGVPILWFPWLRFPTTDARQTGVLYPTLGYDQERGLDITVPYYLNLAPNYDATLYPRLVGRRGFMLGTEFRYLGRISKGVLRVDYMAHDRIADDSRMLLRARSTTRLGQHWRFNVNLNHVSDRSYFEDLGSSLYGNATHLLRSSVYLTGRGDNWHAAIGADQYQITDPQLPASFEPYKRLPRVLFEAHDYVGRTFAYGVRSEFVRFHKDQGLNGRRLDLQPWLDWKLQGPWWYVNPHASWRLTRYQLDRAAHDSPSREMPIISLDTGLFFERDATLFGSHYTQTLEPRLFYLYVPYRDQQLIPIFDTSYQTFGYWQLFSSNQFSGPDRQMNANNLTLALTTRLLDDSGVQRLAASIGQIRYFDPQRVQLPGRPDTDYSGSAYVARVSVGLSERWDLDVTQQWDPHRDQTRLSTVAMQYRLADSGVLNLAYRYRRDFLEQVDVSALYPLSSNWSLVGRWNYSLNQNRTLEALAGIEYSSCCLAVRLVGRHYIRNSAGEASNAIMLQIEFKGLGSIGQDTGDLLHRAILGYSQAGRPITGPLGP